VAAGGALCPRLGCIDCCAQALAVPGRSRDAVAAIGEGSVGGGVDQFQLGVDCRPPEVGHRLAQVLQQRPKAPGHLYRALAELMRLVDREVRKSCQEGTV